MLYLYLFLGNIFLKSVLFRFRGGGFRVIFPPIKYISFLRRPSCALMMSYPILLNGCIFNDLLSYILGGLALVLSTITVSLGHGAYLDLGRSPERENPENVKIGDYYEEPQFAWLGGGTLFGSRKVYELLALSVTGLVYAVPVINSWLILHCWWNALIMTGFSLTKGPVYRFAQWLSDKTGIKKLLIAETLYGGILGIGVALTVLGVLNAVG